MNAIITDYDRAAAAEATAGVVFANMAELDRARRNVAQAIADARSLGSDIACRNAFLAAEQGMKDAEAADYEPAEVARFMLDAISALPVCP